MNLFFVINNSLYVDKSCDCLKIFRYIWWLMHQKVALWGKELIEDE